MNTESILINKKTKFEHEYETLEDGSSRLSCISIYNSSEYNDGTFVESIKLQDNAKAMSAINKYLPESKKLSIASLPHQK